MIPDQSAWGAVLRHISTSSAVNPTMLVSISAMLIGYLGLQFAPDTASIVFSLLIIAPLTVFLGQVIFFTIFDRDRLQNDKHVEQKMIIKNGIEIKRAGKVITVDVPKGEGVSTNPLAQGETE